MIAYSIPLTRGLRAVVDYEDYAYLSQWKWHAIATHGGPPFYAARKITANGKQLVVMMHQVVLPALPGFLVDHIDGDTLDNRRENLRAVLPAENQANARRHAHSGYRYKGTFQGSSGAWYARITVGKKQRKFGPFISDVAAAREYDKLAVAFYGSCAKTNF